MSRRNAGGARSSRRSAYRRAKANQEDGQSMAASAKAAGEIFRDRSCEGDGGDSGMNDLLQQQYDEHPFDEKCTCKLCDWRRPQTKEEVPPEMSFRDFHDGFRKLNRRAFVFHR